jgi:hypothetical protein
LSEFNDVIVWHIFDAITVLVQKQLPITFKSGEQAGTELPAGDAVQKREAAEENAASLFVRIILSTICLCLGTELDCNKDFKQQLLFSRSAVGQQFRQFWLPGIAAIRLIFAEQSIRRTLQSLRNVDNSLQAGFFDPVFDMADIRNRKVCALRQFRLR